MKPFYALLLIILFIPSVSYAFPEDVQAERTRISWTLPTTLTDGTPMTEPLEKVTVYCSNIAGVNQLNSPFIRDIGGTDTQFMMTNFTDATWYCRVTGTLRLESEYSNEVNFTVVGGVVPSIRPSPAVLGTE